MGLSGDYCKVAFLLVLPDEPFRVCSHPGRSWMIGLVASAARSSSSQSRLQQHQSSPLILSQCPPPGAE